MADQQFDELLIAQAGLRIPSGAGSGLVAQSDASGNVTWTAAGKVANTVAAGDVTEFAFSHWKDIFRVGYPINSINIAAGSAVANYLLFASGTATVGNAGSTVAAIYLDPGDYSGGGTRTTKIRVRGTVITNAVAPAASFTFGLYPIATFGGASAQGPSIASLGTVVMSTSAITTPAATSQSHAESSATTFPSAGWYCLVMVLSGGTTATGAIENIGASLQVQQV